MAIIPNIPGVEVTVCVNNQPLPEYEDDEPRMDDDRQARNMVSRYIECVSDQEFTVNISIRRPFHFSSPTLLFDLYVDGHAMNGKTFHEIKYHPGIGLTKTIPGSIVNTGTTKELRSLVFSKIETCVNDDMLASVKDDARKINTIGLIEVKIYRGSDDVRQEATKKSRAFGPETLGFASEVHEKALKGNAKSHGVSYGNIQSIQPVRQSGHRYINTRLDGINNPIGVLNFKYRSRESLKQLLVIRRTPSPEWIPEPLASNSICLDGLAPNQRKEVERFMQGIQGSNGSDILEWKPNIKRERCETITAGPSKRAKNIMTIDLTGDSEGEDIIALD